MNLLTFTLFALFTMFNGSVCAQEVKICTVKSFVKVYMEADKAPYDIRELAIAELKKARAKMVEDDKKACSVHLTNASEMAAAN